MKSAIEAFIFANKPLPELLSAIFSRIAPSTNVTAARAAIGEAGGAIESK